MKKRLITLVCATILCVSAVAGCTKKGEPSNDKDTVSEDSRTVDFSKIGLVYATPETWKKYEKTNIYPKSYATKDTIAQVLYSYITESSLAKINDGNPKVTFDNSTYPICEIVVVEKEKIELDSVKELFSAYNKNELLGEASGCEYYMLTEYNGDLSTLATEEKAKYDEISAASKDIAATVKVSEFDKAAFDAESYKLNNTMTFDTKTIEGKSISSTVFADYDMTLVYFWGTNCYPDFDETKTLQEVYSRMNEVGNVNIITVCTDTPGDNTNLAIEITALAGAYYDTLTLDETLAKFVVNNVEKVPATLFVDSDGLVRGDQMIGTHTADEYISEFSKRLADIKK